MVKRALLIGCNYTATPNVQLCGCIEDVVNIRNMLIDAYGYLPANITILRDDNPDAPNLMPTKNNILMWFHNTVAQCSASDELWVHYSGHGTQINATDDKTEADRLDEAIVPCDYTVAGVIKDDDLFHIISLANCRMLLFFDSCHSGTVCDLEYTMDYSAVSGMSIKSVISSAKLTNPSIIMMSGCRDAQTSADSFNMLSKSSAGAFTNALIESLRANDHNVEIKKLFADVCKWLAANKYSQIPELSCSYPTPSYTFTRSNNALTIVVGGLNQSPVAAAPAASTQKPQTVVPAITRIQAQLTSTQHPSPPPSSISATTNSIITPITTIANSAYKPSQQQTIKIQSPSAVLPFHSVSQKPNTIMPMNVFFNKK